ncbi:MAG TPA: ATP-grasp domain-containing protein [Dehalococcoidia bacterium]|nr:ATP-grasp domain-containing protein [Dehalococcoidia bacterium]
MQRVLLLMATRTYRAKAFMTAAHALGGEVIVGSERRQALSHLARGTSLTLDFRRPENAVKRIADFARKMPLDAVVGVDDGTTLVAAMASQALSLTGNSPESIEAAQNKFQVRELLAMAGLLSPTFWLLPAGGDPATLAAQVIYPCVLKPVFLAASQGVIRANDPREFIAAFERIRAILSRPEVRERGGDWAEKILVESFIPGTEVALEGLLSDGELRVLAIFDKPDQLDGPYFEETIYLTPSRLPRDDQSAIAGTVAQTAAALGLREGPIHAELRLNERGAWIIEIAARSIGGRCSSVLEFGAGVSLEDLILRQAIGAELPEIPDSLRPSGAMMIPIPRRGILRAVKGREQAAAVPGIAGIDITVPVGHEVAPLPEGDRYLGFIFAHGSTLDATESALREAHRRLEFVIA